MSDKAHDHSSLGLESIIATVAVLILASIFIGYYLWPHERSGETVVGQAPAGAMPAHDTTLAPPQRVAGDSGERPKPVAAQRAEAPPATVSDSGEASLADMDDAANEPVAPPPGTETVPASTGAPQSAVTAAAQAGQIQPDASMKSPGVLSSKQVTEPVITYLDRDRVTNELIISGVSPASDDYIVLLINGITTSPIRLDVDKKWRYRFKASAGEYYVRLIPANSQGPLIRTDSLPTLYNISLAPVSPDATEAGAEVSLLSGEYRTIGKGETLVMVAREAGIRPRDLRLVNGLPKDRKLKEGDVVFIPKAQ